MSLESEEVVVLNLEDPQHKPAEYNSYNQLQKKQIELSKEISEIKQMRTSMEDSESGIS